MTTDPKKEQACGVCGRPEWAGGLFDLRQCLRSINGDGAATCYRLGYERLLKERQPAAGPPAPPSAPQDGLFKEKVLAICEAKMREYLDVGEPAGVRAVENVKVAIRALPLPERPTGDTKETK